MSGQNLGLKVPWVEEAVLPVKKYICNKADVIGGRGLCDVTAYFGLPAVDQRFANLEGLLILKSGKK